MVRLIGHRVLPREHLSMVLQGEDRVVRAAGLSTPARSVGRICADEPGPGPAP